MTPPAALAGSRGSPGLGWGTHGLQPGSPLARQKPEERPAFTALLGSILDIADEEC